MHAQIQRSNGPTFLASSVIEKVSWEVAFFLGLIKFKSFKAVQHGMLSVCLHIEGFVSSSCRPNSVLGESFSQEPVQSLADKLLGEPGRVMETLATIKPIIKLKMPRNHSTL